MEYFLSCVTVMKSNTKSSTVQASQTESFPGVAYFLVYRASEACNENKIFALLHNADMEPTITKIRTTTAASSVFQVLKVHANEAVQSLVSTSNSYCFDRAAAELNREETVVEPTNPRSYPTKPCRIVVVNEDEHLTQIMDAYQKLQSDGLSAEIVSLPNAFQTCVPTNPRVVTRTIKDIDRLMEVCGHALYRGKIYTCPDGAALTFVEMMDVDSYLHHVLSNDTLRERVLKHFHVLSRILAHPDCTIIQQLVFDNDLIEVLDGIVFQISMRSFIPCPLPPESFRKKSPRSFVPYDSTKEPNAGYFKDGILHSFPDDVIRSRFLNKFYQCLVAGKMPQKTRKLVTSGPKDSGKTSWAAIFHRLIPANAVATITKENQFSASMVDENTQIVIIDEWSASKMESDLAKTLLQGGWMTTAVMHKLPRCFFNLCPFYITTNKIPDFGAEQEHVSRRLAIYETQSLQEITVGADKWIFDNAMTLSKKEVGLLLLNYRQLSPIIHSATKQFYKTVRRNLQ